MPPLTAMRATAGRRAPPAPRASSRTSVSRYPARLPMRWRSRDDFSSSHRKTFAPLPAPRAVNRGPITPPQDAEDRARPRQDAHLRRVIVDTNRRGEFMHAVAFTGTEVRGGIGS